VMAFLTEQLESRFKFTKQLIPKMDHHWAVQLVVFLDKYKSKLEIDWKGLQDGLQRVSRFFIFKRSVLPATVYGTRLLPMDV
jgi:D-serine dehydratase